MNLRYMQTDQSGTISSVNIGDNLDFRLMERGLIPGPEITAIGRPPLNFPIKRNINVPPLSLRNNEADHIQLSATAIGGNR